MRDDQRRSGGRLLALAMPRALGIVEGVRGVVKRSWKRVREDSDLRTNSMYLQKSNNVPKHGMPSPMRLSIISVEPFKLDVTMTHSASQILQISETIFAVSGRPPRSFVSQIVTRPG